MEKICNLNQCSGCGACVGICPKNCIKLIPDKDSCGHIYPKIDTSRCIDCELCVRTCPVNTDTQLNYPLQAIAAFAKESTILKKSSSGGLAFQTAKWIIENGGIAYGATIQYGRNFHITHKRISTISELEETQGSKYVQSFVPREIYTQLKIDLKNNLKVLFIGTGCQIAGIKNFLKKDFENLYTIDIICHGVPSLKTLKDYLASKIEISGIKDLKFRTSKGFDLTGEAIDKRHFSYPLSKNLYMIGFLKGLYYRDSCYTCRYAQGNRGGDITLGDFWGLNKNVKQSLNSPGGISVALINSAKGKELFEHITAGITYTARPIEEAIAGNKQLRSPSKKHFLNGFFKELYRIIGFNKSASICLIGERLFYGLILPIIKRYHNLK